jgi:hypothetical protein
MGEHRAPYAFGRGHLQSALNLDLGFRAVAQERPDAAFALRINDSLMLAETGRSCGGAGTIEVAGRAQHQSLASADAADCRRRIQQLSHPQRHIDALLHEIDLAASSTTSRSSSGCCARNCGSKGMRRMLAKATAAQTRNRPFSPVPAPRGSEFRLVSLLDRGLGAFEITKPHSARVASSGAVE